MTSQTRRLLLLISALLLLILVVCAGIVAGFYFFATSPNQIARIPSPASTATQPARSTIVVPTVGATSTPPVSNSTLDDLIRIDIPRNDPTQIIARLKGNAPILATPTAPPTYRVGDKAAFWVSRDITGTNELVTSTLKLVTEHAYWWVEDSETVDESGLEAAGDDFEKQVYPTDRLYIGEEASLGVDNDPHVYVLNTHFTGGIAGYISQVDEYPQSVNRISNQHKMIYMNMRTERPGTTYYTSVIAHEFTHIIHEHQNPREGSWITEGLGDLAIKLNGFQQGVDNFVQNPDIQLNAWANRPSAMLPHYEGAYLFLSYCLNRFGPGFIRDVVDSGTHDIYSIQSALDKHAPGVKFDDLFADWVVANYTDDRSAGSRYSYMDHALGIRPQVAISQYPTRQDGTVHQYGSEYVQLEPAGHDVTVTFDGSKQVQAIPTNPHSGKMMWWGNHVDSADTTLTREFDLSNVQKATLSFWAWYDIEANFDYGYVEASADGGKSWTALSVSTSTHEDPNGANYGNGLTCKSTTGCDDNAPPPQWVQETADLSPYVGKKVQVRFEYITDGIYTGSGLAVDDISIPEINFSDDVEVGDNGWEAAGFVRMDNSLSQRFIVQAIEFNASGGVHVLPISLDPSNHGTLTTTGFGKSISSIVLVISGSTPVTWESASYSFSVQ